MKKLSEFATLAAAHEYPEDNYALVTPNAVTQAMLTCSQTEEIYLYFRNSTEQLKVAFMDVLKRGDSLDFSEGTEDGQINHLLLNGIIAAEQDAGISAALQTLKVMLTTKADNTEKPYKDVTQDELDAAKYAHNNVTTKDLNWEGQSKLRITLTDDLYEPTTLLLTYSDGFLVNENLGRPKRLSSAGTYEIDLKGVIKKDSVLHINFNIHANAIVELV